MAEPLRSVASRQTEITPYNQSAELIDLAAARTERMWSSILKRQARYLTEEPGRYTVLDGVIPELAAKHPQLVIPAFESMALHESPAIRSMAAEELPLLMREHRFLAASWLVKLLHDQDVGVSAEAQVSGFTLGQLASNPALRAYIDRKVEESE